MGVLAVLRTVVFSGKESIENRNTGTPFSTWVNGHQTLVFVFLAYSLSWSVFIGLAVFRVDSPLVMLGVYGPSLAAILLSGYLVGWQGIRNLLVRITIWRVGLRWYAILLFGFVAIEIAGYGFYRLSGGAALSITVPTLASLLPVLLIQVLVPGFGEEFGWRGFVLPRLQARWSPVMASVVLSLIHLFWHFPTYWLGIGTHNVPLVLMIAWIVPFTILYTWIYNNTQGSILIAVLYHALFGVTLSFMPFLPSESVVPITPTLIGTFTFTSVFGPYLAVTALFWVVAIVVAVATRGRLGYVR